MKKLFLPLFLSLALLCSCSQANATWQEQYDLGVKYLSEGNYEEAILAFEAAIEIDPKRAEAYIGLAETYVAMDDPDRAAEILQQGMEAIGESDLLTNAWNDLGLTPPENGGGEGDSNGEDSFASAEDLSFADMTPEEITAILPSLTQPKPARTEEENMDAEIGYSILYTYDSDGRIIEETGEYPDGSIYYVKSKYYDEFNHQLSINNFSDGSTSYQISELTGGHWDRLLLNHRISPSDSPIDHFSTFHYSYSENLVDITITWELIDETLSCTVSYTMSSPENVIEIFSWGRHNNEMELHLWETDVTGVDLTEHTITAVCTSN